MLKRTLACAAFLMVTSICFSWGFLGHQLVNRYAVFTLPEQLLGFYKEHISYITLHAVDPDKRRYTDPAEAVRHYIDIDHYEHLLPFDTLPVYWKDAVSMYTTDTLHTYGMVPWHINMMYHRLTQAFKEKEEKRILQLSAEIGHYMADACVPLHVTENYNGQLTGQSGIHGLWESRIPELFHHDFDFFAGRAIYLEQVQTVVWSAIQGSYAAKDSVLMFEKMLSSGYRPDLKYMMAQKGSVQLKTYSEAYVTDYSNLLNGMVERRLRLSVYLTGCLWYTAWVDAGQPDLPSTVTQKVQHLETLEDEQQKLNQEMKGRKE